MNATILYYKLFPIPDPELFRLWQKSLCEKLELKGRIIISEHGINGTLGGSRKALRAYLVETKLWNELTLDSKWAFDIKEVPFPKLSVKVRPELVTFNAPNEIKVNAKGVVDGGEHVSANQLHDLLTRISQETNVPVEELSGKEVLFFDGRNGYEYELGRFKNSFDPGVENAKEFIPLLDSGVLDEWKNKPVITYCTGGIRCELLTPLMKARGFEKVYQIDGGIVRYLENSKNDHGLWEGSVYTFDQRKKVYGDYSEVIGACSWCGDKSENHENCRDCQKQIIVCDDCWTEKGHCVHC